MVKIKVVCKNPLDCFIEPIDIMEYYGGGSTVLDEPPHDYGIKDPDKRPTPVQSKNVSKTEIMVLEEDITHMTSNYGRGYTQTLTDTVLDQYKEHFIAKALKCILQQHCEEFIVIPDYSPYDGRLHFHGILRFKHLKDMSRLRRKLKIFGWSKIDQEPKEGLAEYTTKLFRKNKYTPANTPIEPLDRKMVIIKKKD